MIAIDVYDPILVGRLLTFALHYKMTQRSPVIKTGHENKLRS